MKAGRNLNAEARPNIRLFAGIACRGFRKRTGRQSSKPEKKP
jgi:hypothetical protein